MASRTDRLRVAIQRVLPQHALSRLVGWIANARAPRLLLDPAIAIFRRIYDVDLSEAQIPAGGFASFQDFFTRALKPGARPLPAEENVLVSPVDGTVSISGPIEEGRLFQAKGQRYSLAELMGSAAAARGYEGGTFATIYLAPRDYHRIHSPAPMRITRQRYVPGRLWSVNPVTDRVIRGLFAQNERVVVEGHSPAGALSLVLVGAVIVGSIETVWHGVVAPGPERRTGGGEWEYPDLDRYRPAAGDELGRFRMGSTVIVLVPPGTGRLDPLAPGQVLRMGERIGKLGVPEK